MVKTFLRLLYFYVSKTFDIWEDKIKTNCSFLNKKLCVSKTNLHVITGTVFRASQTNSRKGFKFLPDVVMSHKIEKKLENVLNITFLEKNHGVRVLSHNKGPHSVCKL